MWTTQFLVSFVTSAAAKESLARIVDAGLSPSQDFLSLNPIPFCLDIHGDNWDNQSSQPDPLRSLASALWKHATPCANNGTKAYCVYSNPEFAGRGISIITSPGRAVGIAESEAFTNTDVLGSIDDLNAKESPRWKVADVPGKGLGLIATRNIEMGDHIMSTTASVMIDYSVFYDIMPDEIQDMQVAAVNYLPNKHRSIVLNLSTHDHAADYKTRVNKVIQTNSFDIYNIESPHSTDVSQNETFYTVFPESRKSQAAIHQIFFTHKLQCLV